MYSKIIAGTMTWGQWGKKHSKTEMIDTINYCLENNITTFDHADIYGDYTTEADFGNAFTESNITRDAIQLISKCGIQLPGNSRSKLQVKHYNYSKDYIIWSAENSLKNLKTDYLDLLLLHRPSPLMQPEEVAEAISILKKQGKIKNFGVSNFTTSQTELLSQFTNISVNQIEFSLTQHTAMHDGVLDTLMAKKIKPMCWSPLGTVFKDTNEQTTRVHLQLEKLIEKYNATKDQLLLAWILKHPANITPVIGTTTKERLKNAYNATNIHLDIEDWFLILNACQGHEVP
ncbi:aldo/keto reductase [Corallibacter sp.]|uniref:aldo/keto reductase n=1 Tax=Corallibacter sp. TaxID=2038084 RepID=UPI003AB757AA